MITSTQVAYDLFRRIYMQCDSWNTWAVTEILFNIHLQKVMIVGLQTSRVTCIYIVEFVLWRSGLAARA
jgi:hypothetical protein